MSLTTTSDVPSHQVPAARIIPVAFDLYRDIHKAIRVELFELTADAGRLDPADTFGVVALADHVRRTMALLVEHAEHEDGAVQPVLEAELPRLAAQVAGEHVVLEGRMERLEQLAGAAVAAPAAMRRAAVHETYLELAAFTSAYLDHQDLEERLVMPALEIAVGVDAVIGIHGRILEAIPPDEMGRSLALMFPAMNVDDRTDLLGGMRAGAPAEVFAGVWSLARSVLGPEDGAALAARLGC